MPDKVLMAMAILPPSILMTAHGAGYYYYHHFKNGETKVK